MSSTAAFIPKRIPPDLPLGGRQCQTKSAPPDNRARFDFDISCFPVSITAIKSSLWSLTASDIYQNLAKSDRPLLFQKKPFMVNFC